MKKVERHVIKPSHQFYQECDKLTLSSKNLFNCAMYIIRQSYFYGHGVISLAELNTIFKESSQYKALPAKVSQLVLKQVVDAWESYFKARNAYKLSPCKFTGKPKIPGYAEKRNLVKYNYQALAKGEFKKTRLLKPSKTNISIGVSSKLSFEDICELRIVPRIGCYVIEIVYEVEMGCLGASHPTNNPSQIAENTEPGVEVSQTKCVDNASQARSQIVAAIDLGLDNLATVVFNQPELQPFIINGKPLKSVNQWWNKQKAFLQRLLPDCQKTSRKIEAITRHRNNYVDTYIHSATKQIVDELRKLNVSKVVIGQNSDWKRNVNLGKVNNQKFVQIPYNKLIDRLTYKLHYVGISVIITEESYTSKASFLDWDNIPTYDPHVKAKYSCLRYSD